ncbi:class I SAM-dependent methyltransferase [Sagittula sp. S175]|uniref:class I SAM-dependent methyltransferase n=1 Tax=Sagittula sp. S175 TaxID=3415129 RepID=UPI003C7B7999
MDDPQAWDAFLTLHRGLDREGPGTPEDVAWAFALGEVAADARVCDVGSGPGGDMAALLQAVPEGRVVAVDAVPSFVSEARARFANEPRVEVIQGDMAALPGPFDAIWCAGALYFLGLEEGPRAMAGALRPRGMLAFSEPCVWGEGSEGAAALFEGYPARDEAGIRAAVEAAGFDVLGTRRVPDAGWEAYFAGVEARAQALEPAEGALAEVIAAQRSEAETWRRYKDETGYLLVVARLR